MKSSIKMIILYYLCITIIGGQDIFEKQTNLQPNEKIVFSFRTTNLFTFGMKSYETELAKLVFDPALSKFDVTSPSTNSQTNQCLKRRNGESWNMTAWDTLFVVYSQDSNLMLSQEKQIIRTGISGINNTTSVYFQYDNATVNYCLKCWKKV